MDLHTYLDVVPYLYSMHPKFKKYMLDVEQNEFAENVFILDSDYRIIEPDEAQMRRNRNKCIQIAQKTRTFLIFQFPKR